MEGLELDEITLINTIPGNRKMESRLHNLFRNKRVRGNPAAETRGAAIFGRHSGLDYYMKTTSQLLHEAITALDALPEEELIRCMGPLHPSHPEHLAHKQWQAERFLVPAG